MSDHHASREEESRNDEAIISIALDIKGRSQVQTIVSTVWAMFTTYRAFMMMTGMASTNTLMSTNGVISNEIILGRYMLISLFVMTIGGVFWCRVDSVTYSIPQMLVVQKVVSG